MTLDDVRHGTDSGYSNGGCRDQCCADAHRRAQKERTLFRLRNGSCRVPQEELRKVLDPWLRMGVTLHALAEAAGKCSDRLFTTEMIQRETFAAFAAITEDDLLASSRVPADLTRRRIYSLMAAGHVLNDMPIEAKSHWRRANLIEIRIARTVRDYYRANEFKLGPSTYTATRAKNAGHRAPLAWDDPDTLAWPDGKPPRSSIGRVVTRKADIDPIAVERIVNGDRSQSYTVAERRAAVEVLWRRGMTVLAIAQATGLKRKDVDKDIERCGLRRGEAA
jgi:hypothetical protein